MSALDLKLDCCRLSNGRGQTKKQAGKENEGENKASLASVPSFFGACWQSLVLDYPSLEANLDLSKFDYKRF